MKVNYKIPAYSGAGEVVSLEDAKLQIRIEHDYEDTEVQGFIDAAVAEAESYLGGPILEREVVFGIPDWQLRTDFPSGPVTAITSVEYLASGDESYTTLAATNYKLYNFGTTHQQLIIKSAAHSTTLEEETDDAIQITATVGWPEAEIPQDIINAVKLLLTDKYEYHGEKELKMNRSSRTLLRAYRQY